MGRNERAIEAFARVLNLDPRNFHAYNNLGIVYKNLNSPENAIVYYTQAVGLNPNSYWTWYNLALSYEDLQLWSEAQYALTQVLKIRSDYQPAAIHLRKVESFLEQSQKKIYTIALKNREERDKKSDEGAKNIRVNNPNSIFFTKPEISFDEAIALENQRNKPAGREFAGALTALKSGDIPKAVFGYLKSVDLDSDTLGKSDFGILQKGIEYFRDKNQKVDGLYAYSRLLHLNGDVNQALLIYKRILTEYPDSQYATKVKDPARFLDFLINGLKKMEITEAGTIKKPENPDLVPVPVTPSTGTPQALEEAANAHTKGMELFKSGQIEGAITHFKKAVELNSNASLFHHSLGLALAERFLVGDRDAGPMALQSFEKELAMDPNASTAMEARIMVEEIKKRLN